MACSTLIVGVVLIILVLDGSILFSLPLLFDVIVIKSLKILLSIQR